MSKTGVIFDLDLMTSYRSRFLPVYFIVWFSDFEILLDLGVQWSFIFEHRLFNGPVDLESCIFFVLLLDYIDLGY